MDADRKRGCDGHAALLLVGMAAGFRGRRPHPVAAGRHQHQLRARGTVAEGGARLGRIVVVHDGAGGGGSGYGGVLRVAQVTVKCSSASASRSPSTGTVMRPRSAPP